MKQIHVKGAVTVLNSSSKFLSSLLETFMQTRNYSKITLMKSTHIQYKNQCYLSLGKQKAAYGGS